MKLTGGGTQTRQTHGELRLPAMFQQILRVRGQRERFLLPPAKPEECADSKPAKSRGVTALRAIEPPVEIAFRSRGEQVRVSLAIVCLLVNHQPFHSGFHDRKII